MAPLLNATITGDEVNFKMSAIGYDNTNDGSEGMVKINDDVIDNDAPKDIFKDLSKIQKFYDGKNILITGATGFLGKILVEKLLRCCPGVQNLYLLVRQKRGKDIYTRLEEIFEDPVFDRLKEEVPKFRHKIVVMPADCEAAGLGLILTDRQTLTEKVNIIFHCAATVKFDEHLRAALNTNVRAPLHLLRLARDMKGLDVLMHISTAYSNSHLEHVEERFYPCEADCETLHQNIDKMTDGEINNVLSKILGDWPNTYTFTKALAEKELRVNANGIPLGIFRPAIVISTAKEPVKCWLDNMYGPNGIAVGSATGILRTLQCDSRTTADVVPVDLAVNCLMVAAADVTAAYKQSNPPLEPPIFNYVSSVENRITWGDFMALNMERVHKYPFSNAVWYISLRLTKSWLMNNIYIFFLHLIPAALVDGLAVCLGKKPKMLKVYRKIHKFSSVLSYFCTREIAFSNSRTQKLWEITTTEDKQAHMGHLYTSQNSFTLPLLRDNYGPVLRRSSARNSVTIVCLFSKIFPFSMAELEWREYFDDYFAGIRRYLFKESDDTLPQARIKWKRLYYLHQLVRIIFYVLVIYVLWYIFSALL